MKSLALSFPLSLISDSNLALQGLICMACENLWEEDGVSHFSCRVCDYDECTACVAKATKEGGPIGTIL